MPQIWLTYDELAELLDCDRGAARGAATAAGLDRRRSRDGHTRAKLSAALTQAFLDRLARQRLEYEIDEHQIGEHQIGEHQIGEREIAAAVGDLRAIAARMAVHAAERPDLRAPIDRDRRDTDSTLRRFGIGE